MVVKFRTESGSVYEVDYEKRTWKSSSLNTRTSEGEFTFASPQVTVGEAFVMFGKGLKFGTRLIATSPVVEVLDAAT